MRERRSRPVAAPGVVIAALAIAGAGCGDGARRTYDNNDLQLVTGYAAKELCSCLFVMRQSEAFCERWTRASPNIRSFHVDRARRTVEAQSVLAWGARARWVSQRAGCVIE